MTAPHTRGSPAVCAEVAQPSIRSPSIVARCLGKGGSGRTVRARECGTVHGEAGMVDGIRQVAAALAVLAVATACNNAPGEDGLRASFAEQLAANRFVRDFEPYRR